LQLLVRPFGTLLRIIECRTFDQLF
jgi:hypothetical protein